MSIQINAKRVSSKRALTCVCVCVCVRVCVCVCVFIVLAHHNNGSQRALIKVCMSDQGGMLYQGKKEDKCAHTKVVHTVGSLV